MRLLLTVLISLTTFINYSQDFLWARQFEGYENEISKKITTSIKTNVGDNFFDLLSLIHNKQVSGFLQ